MVNKVTIMKDRASFYQFLSRLFEKEISGELLRQLVNVEYPEDISQSKMQEGYKGLAEFFKNVNVMRKYFWQQAR